MIGVKVTLPIACFRKGMAREYLETHELPPPSTCYGFLLSLIGETDRESHQGVHVTAAINGDNVKSVILRTVWRIKKNPLGSPGNTKPDYQQLLTNIDLIIWLDSSEETPSEGKHTLEELVLTALNPKTRKEIDRFGGLSLGESTHLINDISIYKQKDAPKEGEENNAKIFLLDKEGMTTLPVWVDHVGGENTRYAIGNIVPGGLVPPDRNLMPVILSQ